MIDGTPERDRLTSTLEVIEQVSRKRSQKWHSSRHEERFAYMTAILTNSAFKGLMFYQMHHASREYVEMTVQTTALAISGAALRDYKATVLVDGLPDSEKHAFGIALRRRGVKTKKVHGVDDRKETFIRLADALCGLIIDANEGNEAYRGLLEEGLHKGFIADVGK